MEHQVDWETCSNGDCIGVRVGADGACWAHTTESDLSAALEQLREHGLLDARGVPLTPVVLDRLLGAAPRGGHGEAMLAGAWFTMATFYGDARFERVAFQGHAWFDEVSFQGEAQFAGATFHGLAGFRNTIFHGLAGFRAVDFKDTAHFTQATFKHLEPPRD